MSVYHELAKLGARLVLSGSRPAQDATEKRPARPETPESSRGKVPLREDWLKCRPPTGDNAINHLQRRGFKGDNHVGVVPGSLDLLVVDVDDPDHSQALFEAVGPPLLKIPSRHGDDGRFHAYFKKPPTLEGEEPLIVGNQKWAGGELRCDNGFVVLWGGEKTVKAIAEQWPSIAPIRLDAIPSIKSTSRRAGAKIKVEVPDELPDPLDDDALDQLFELFPRLEAAFHHKKEEFRGKKDYTNSGWDGTLSTVAIGNGVANEVVIALLRAHNISQGEDKIGGDGGGYYYRTLRTGHEWIADEQSKELAALAPTPEPENADLGASPMLDKKARARLFREDPKLKDAIEHRLGGQGGTSFEEHDRRIAERAFNAGATPAKVVGTLKWHYDQWEDSPDREDKYYRDLVLTVREAMPVPTKEITNSENPVNDILGVPGFRMIRVLTPGDSSPPEFRFVVDGRAVHAGAPSFLLNQNAFRSSVLAIYKRMAKGFRPKDWPLAVARLVEEADDVKPGHELYPSSHDDMAELKDMLEGYITLSFDKLTDWREVDVEVIRVSFSGNFGRNPEQQKPFYWGEEVHIFLASFQRWLQISREYKVSPTQLASSLRQVGWKPVRPEKQGFKFPRCWRKIRKLEKA